MDLPHLRLEGTAKPEKYVYAGPTPQGNTGISLPSRPSASHANKVKSELQKAVSDARRLRQDFPLAADFQPEGVVLAFISDPGYQLDLEALDKPTRGKLLSVSVKDNCQIAMVFVPKDELKPFLKAVEAYAASTVLTYHVAPDKKDRLRGLEDEGTDIRFWAPEYPVKDSTDIKLRFVMPDAEVAAFMAKAATLGTLKETTRKNQNLIASIGLIRLAMIEDFWQDHVPLPPPDKDIWWEVWLHGTRSTAQDVYHRFRELAKAVGITQISERYVTFPERIVLHVNSNAKNMARSIDLLAMVSELRLGKELATPYVNLKASDQADFSKDAVARMKLPEADAPCVTVVDGGVHRGHILVEPHLAQADCHAAIDAWGTADINPAQHGTEMAGIAAYGCLTQILNTQGQIRIRHVLESVKILPPAPAINDPPDYGVRMQDGVAKAFIQAPQRNRVLCMALTADSRDLGAPTLWSAAVDDMCAGSLDDIKKLLFVSAGNVRAELFSPEYRYHEWNTTRAGLEDPGQAWNAVTVGAFTEKVIIDDPTLNGWNPIAEAGDLCPTSRTSLPWSETNQDEWPIKPEIVMEGGNYAFRNNDRSAVDDLSLLTTHLYADGRLFETTRDTSPATAQAARFAAILWSRYPRLRPETIRALMVHSARWTPRMLQHFPRNTKTEVHRLLRCYGYGTPDMDLAVKSAENNVTLIYEGELQPFILENGTVKTNQMHIHALPWPKKQLEDLAQTQIRLRVTLSYFAEPSPDGVGWRANHSYQSPGLRFDVIRLASETRDEFKQRISKADRPKGKRSPSPNETRNWIVGEKGRHHGSLHSDWWTGTGAELATCNYVAVYPVAGWWKERAHLGQYGKLARYSLIISLEAPEVDVQLYSAITSLTNVVTETMV